MEQILTRHVSGRLKVAPEHTSPRTLHFMRKPAFEHFKNFKKKLRVARAMGVDMETATLFVVGFKNEIPRGAILLVSDNPMVPYGVKTDQSDKSVTSKYVVDHLEIGIKSLIELRDSGNSVKHMKFS